VGSRDGVAAAEAEVAHAVERMEATVAAVASRVVKAYGPGRQHVAVDLTARPGPRGFD